MELIYETGSKEILNDTLEKMEKGMHNTLETFGLEDMIEEWNMRVLHELFMEKKSEHLAKAANSIELKPLIDEVKE